MIRSHAGETRRIDVSALVPCLQVLRGLATLPGLQVPWAFQVKLDIADDGNLKALLLPCPADQMLMWEKSPQVNSPKNDDVNTGSDRDDGKRLTRFNVAISHIGFAGSNDEPSGRKSGSRDKAL